MTDTLQIQPYTYYNPDKVPPWAIALGVAAVAGVGYLLLRPREASAAAPATGDGTTGPGPEPGPVHPPGSSPPAPGPGDVAPGPDTLPPPPTDPEHPGGLAPPEIEPGPVDVETTTGLDVADYPWGQDGTLYVHPSVATPSMMYRVKAGDNHQRIVRNAVGSALALAGRPELVGHMNPNNAALYAEEWAQRLRQQMADALICSWWNDTLYGQTDPQKAGGASAIGPNGHGLNWTPVHRNNLGLLANAEPAERSTTLSGNRDPDFTAAQASSQMDLWIPAVNLETLKAPAKENLNLVFDLAWPNGLRTINPPPAVSDGLGINTAYSGEFVGGCPGWKQA